MDNPISPSPGQADRTSRAELILDQEVPGATPGISVVVISRGAVVLQSCRGLADLETGLEITPEIAFDLASVSKQFTAVAILLLMERGQLSLFDRMDQHVPEWWGYGQGRPIVLLDLLWHTSGLPNYSQVWKGTPLDAAQGNREYLDQLLLHPQQFTAGSRTDYSNSNYIMLADVVERVTGRSLRRFLAEEVFLPCGLTNTTVQDTPEIPVPWRAHGYRRTPDGGHCESEFLIHLVGHSHLFSTGVDLARYYLALWSNRILAPATIQWALGRGNLDSGENHEYGFGWYDESHRGYFAMGHGGYWDGFRNHVRRYPEADLTIVVLGNDEDREVIPLVDRLAAIYLPADSSRV